MFRPIRVDHTNCLQVAIKTHSFIHSDGHDLRILLSYITRRPGFVDTPPGIHHQTARSLHTHNHPLTDVADSMTSIHRHSGRKVLRQTATLWPSGSTCMRRVGRDHAPGEVRSIHHFSAASNKERPCGNSGLNSSATLLAVLSSCSTRHSDIACKLSVTSSFRLQISVYFSSCSSWHGRLSRTLPLFTATPADPPW
jgi:hypothetical protein